MHTAIVIGRRLIVPQVSGQMAMFPFAGPQELARVMNQVLPKNTALRLIWAGDGLSCHRTQVPRGSSKWVREALMDGLPRLDDRRRWWSFERILLEKQDEITVRVWQEEAAFLDVLADELRHLNGPRLHFVWPWSVLLPSKVTEGRGRATVIEMDEGILWLGANEKGDCVKGYFPRSEERVWGERLTEMARLSGMGGGNEVQIPGILQWISDRPTDNAEPLSPFEVQKRNRIRACTWIDLAKQITRAPVELTANLLPADARPRSFALERYGLGIAASVVALVGVWGYVEEEKAKAEYNRAETKVRQVEIQGQRVNRLQTELARLNSLYAEAVLQEESPPANFFQLIGSVVPHVATLDLLSWDERGRVVLEGKTKVVDADKNRSRPLWYSQMESALLAGLPRHQAQATGGNWDERNGTFRLEAHIQAKGNDL